MTELSSVATDRLRELLPSLLGSERGGLVGFLVHLAEFDRRRGWEGLGYGTLWDFCARELKLQKSCIYRRTNAAWLITRFPRAIERLRSGALTMTTLVVLRDVLTESNSEELLTSAEWKSKDEVEAIAAALAPRPAPSPMIRKLPAPAVALALGIEQSPATSTLVCEEPAPAPVRGSIETTALDGVEYAFRGVAKQAFADKLRRAQEILSHAVPDGDPIKVLERALDALIEQHAKTLAEPARAREGKKGQDAPASRHIPAPVARAVRRRDDDQCCFVLADGSRCGSRWKLELDHIVAWALGGASTVENLRLACAAHNSLHARQTFGADVIDRHVASSSSGATRNGDRPPGR